jgi:signal transduction histidine kinase
MRVGARGALLFAAGLAGATGLTLWLGLRATREWQRSTVEAAERRGNEVVTLLAAALERDMKGGHVSVLLKVQERELAQVAPYELADRFARGFARFPYLDSFFVWTAGLGDGSTYAFNRADRRPAWDRDTVADVPYPVVIRQHPEALRSTVLLARAQGRLGVRLTLFEVSIEGVRYQVIAHLLYDGVGETATLKSAVGFLVNLEWVEQHYFPDVLAQVQQIIDDASLSLEVVDNTGAVVASVGPPLVEGSAPVGSTHVRHFSLAFAEQALSDAPQRFRDPTWMTRVGVANETTRLAATRGGTRTLLLLGLGTLVTIVGLGVTVRAARRSAELAEVQSEFVSAVSHEMKTPLSLIKLASDTLAHGRYASPDAIGEYGQMIMKESQHLTRLIDNVLCYARITDSSSEYDLEVIDLAEVAQETLDRFAPQLKEAGFEVQLQLPAEPIFVRADPLMLGQVFDNLVDNAIKYAAAGRWMGVSVATDGSRARIEVSDRGEGVPTDERARIFDKFYRRKGTRLRGAGLGLAIVRRIVEDHRGTVDVTGATGQGTTFVVTLPKAFT